MSRPASPTRAAAPAGPALLAVLLLALLLATAQAALADAPPQAVPLAVGKSMVVRTAQPAARVSVADEGIAGVVVLSPQQVYITGKKPGGTTLTLWNAAGAITQVYDIQVTPDLAQLKEMLHRVLPDEKDIMVMAVGESITLAGTVRSSAGMTTALDMARLYAPDKVTNLMQVGGVHQVMLEVKVAEMRKTVLERLGIDLTYAWNNDFAFTMLSQLFTLDSQKGVVDVGPSAAIPSTNVNGMFRITSGQVNLMGFLDVLKQNGLVKVLAEPTLICRSGENADFLAGGEIPIPVPQGLGTVAIEYKKYGVTLGFTPTVVSDKLISMRVSPEVSELDYANVIEINGFTIPAISTRRAATTVELADGQSFAVAGLLRDEVRENIKKYPVLGDVPLLGTLFRSSNWQKNETELVIIVTPRLAKPLDGATAKLPTDGFREPTEFEFFLQGKMEGEAPAITAPAAYTPARSPADAPSGMEGEFGHVLPGYGSGHAQGSKP